MRGSAMVVTPASEAGDLGSSPSPAAKGITSMYFVYLAKCEDGSIYTGITTDLKRRLKEHQSGIGGKYTRAKKVTKILHTEKFSTRSLASKREAEIKSWDRKRKLDLIK